MILRPVAFKYRSKRPDPSWRNAWDWALFTGSFVPALVFGVAVGNVLLGVPFSLDNDLRMTYEGSFFALFSPFSLLCGLLSVAMLVTHGSVWLVMRASGDIAARAAGRHSNGRPQHRSVCSRRVSRCQRLCGRFPHYIRNRSEHGSQSTGEAGGHRRWGVDVQLHCPPHPLAGPGLGFLGLFGTLVLLQTRFEMPIFLFSKLAIFGIISTVGVSMFPFILPSSIQPEASLTVWDASSSHRTLFNMLVATLIFLPIILVYTAWVYKVLWGKVDEETIERDNHSAY